MDQANIWFRQYGAMCHTAPDTMYLLHDKFKGFVTSQGDDINWPLDYFKFKLMERHKIQGPWHTVCVDLTGPLRDQLVLCVLCVLCRIDSQNGPNIIRALSECEHIIARHACPSIVTIMPWYSTVTNSRNYWKIIP